MTSSLDPVAGEGVWVDEYRRRAREAWGEKRASAIDEAVRRTALAVRRLMQIEFEPSEPPGFYPGSFRDSLRDSLREVRAADE